MKLDEENLKEEIKGLSEEIRNWLIDEAKKRGDTLINNEDGSIDCMETDNINGIHTSKQGWTIAPPYSFDDEQDKGSE